MKMNVPPAIAAIAGDGQLTVAQRRRFLLDLAKRRAKPGTGSGPDFLQRRTAMIQWPDLRPILQGIPWVIVGGVATRAYMPERATKDMDVLVREQDSEEALKQLQLAGYEQVSELAILGVLLLSPDGIEIDVLWDEQPWMDEALASPNQDVVGYPVLGLPYLVLMKISAARTIDLGDLARMLGLAPKVELEQVRNVVTKYAPDAVEDLESLIYLGQLEMGTLPNDTSDS